MNYLNLFKGVVKKCTPPILIFLCRKIIPRKYGWHGEYNDWGEVLAKSSGYDSEEILRVVKKSLALVKSGEAVYERDGVLFENVQINWPLLSGLLYVAARSKGQLHVVDFGGSLGSTYYQNREFLRNLDSVKWEIVEQKKFVEEGKRSFSDEKLNFSYTIDECLSKFEPNTLLLSSVIQYIEKPYELLIDILKSRNFKYVIIDRTPFVKNGVAIIKHQIVDPGIYSASYPCWFLDLFEFEKFFKDKGYNLLQSFDALDGSGEEHMFLGFIMELNENV